MSVIQSRFSQVQHAIRGGDAVVLVSHRQYVFDSNSSRSALGGIPYPIALILPHSSPSDRASPARQSAVRVQGTWRTYGTFFYHSWNFPPARFAYQISRRTSANRHMLRRVLAYNNVVKQAYKNRAGVGANKPPHELPSEARTFVGGLFAPTGVQDKSHRLTRAPSRYPIRIVNRFPSTR